MDSKKVITKGEKVKAFLKKYLYVICIGVALIAFSVTLILTTALQSKPVNVPPVIDNPTPNPGGGGEIVKPLPDPIDLTAVMPMTDATIIKGFSTTVHQYNKTLKEWTIHKAVDFKAAEGKLDVYSILDGKVLSVKSDRGFGTIITIEHAGNYTSIYKSLSSDKVTVKAGDMVKKGAKIGEASNQAKNEELDGPHLHFELLKSGLVIDPSILLNLGDK